MIDAARGEKRFRTRSDAVLKAARLIVVMATHNGADWIERVLAGYLRQQDINFPWALLVIDNGSTDATPAVLERLRSSPLPLVVVSEPRPGKNTALNSGLCAVHNPNCDFIFTDDDAVPENDFLAAWAKAFAAHDEYALFGGTVVADFEGVDVSVAQRYAKWYAEIYACNERDEGAIPPGAIFGPNMAVAGGIIRAGFRFNEAIGPNTSDPAYPMGSETEFCVRVAREADARCWFTPAPRVSHIVRQKQTTEDFILARAYRHGRGCASKDGHIVIGPLDPLKVRLLLARLWLPALAGSAEARWNAAWHRGYRAGLRENLLKRLTPQSETAPPIQHVNIA